MTDWTAAVAKMRALVGVYLAALAKGPLSPHQAAALATDLKTLDVDLAALGKPATVAPTVPVSDDYFQSGSSDVQITAGGSPDNPNGIGFTFGQAVDWWRFVFANQLNIGKVRASLTPGSKVLTPEGLTAARELGAASTVFAPEDYNPLGLPVIP